MPRRSNRMYPPSQAGTGGFATVKKPIVTLKIELPPMSSAAAFKRGLELAEKVKEDDSTRLKAINVSN